MMLMRDVKTNDIVTVDFNAETPADAIIARGDTPLSTLTYTANTLEKALSYLLVQEHVKDQRGEGVMMADVRLMMIDTDGWNHPDRVAQRNTTGFFTWTHSYREKGKIVGPVEYKIQVYEVDDDGKPKQQSVRDPKTGVATNQYIETVEWKKAMSAFRRMEDYYDAVTNTLPELIIKQGRVLPRGIESPGGATEAVDPIDTRPAPGGPKKPK